MTPKEQSSTSNQKSPKHKLALEEKYKNDHKRLPKPAGWRILVLPFKSAEKSKGGIIYSDQAMERAYIASTCGNVLAVGPHAYDKERFPEGPWCKVGDWVIFARYAGSRIQIEDGEVRLLNDDEILATVEDPTDLIHVTT